jgi:phospholipase C
MQRRVLGLLSSFVSFGFLIGCGSADGATASETTGDDSGAPPVTQVDTENVDGGGVVDSGAHPSSDASSNDGGDAAGGKSKIEHVVILIQENHTFDAYFGRYCTAPTGSDPTCTTGPGCCEAAPDTEPSGASPKTLDDSQNATYDPNHTQACELGEMNGGAMDKYVTGASCSNAGNFAIATDAVKAYHDYAGQYALADRYFQPIVGQSSSNDMYFAEAQYVFTDNAYEPDSNGHGCSLTRTTITYKGHKTIGDVLVDAKKTFAFYAEGYQSMINSTLCPLPPSDCPAHIPTAPCDYDPGDVPFEYYAQFQDDPFYMRDFSQLGKDVTSGDLPDVVFVKALQYKNEHPGYGTKISMGVDFMSGVIDSILASKYASNTLILLTWDEGGGFFDHVKPPPDSPADHQPYGTRVPLLAMGPFTKTNHVSHVVMEHSSIVKFLEWNFTGATGQLGGRDAIVANLGDLLDSAKVGVTVPSD